MKSYFNLIYIATNRFSSEKICVGVLANIEGIPYLGVSDKKLNFSLSFVNAEMRTFIRKSFKLLDFDVNKIRRGEDTLSLFDQPYSQKILKELANKKRGIIQYSDVFELEKFDKNLFEKLFKKFTGEIWEESKKSKSNNLTFKKRFKTYSADKRFTSFEKSFKLNPEEYSFIYKEIRVDLYRESNFLTIFMPLDIEQSVQTIQRNLSRFRLVIQSLKTYSENNGLGKGRYYLVYDSSKQKDKRELVSQIKSEISSGFELIRMSEMKDKV